jgi:hypothetical protein
MRNCVEKKKTAADPLFTVYTPCQRARSLSGNLLPVILNGAKNLQKYRSPKHTP